jgi:biopolymer transport protein ExbD
MAGALGTKQPRSDINITPLVDVVLVLLIIFMVLTPLLEKEVAIRVPEQPDKNEIVPPPPQDQPNQYVLRVDADGKITINGNALADDTGSEELKKYYRQAKSNESKDGPPVIFFDADDKSKYIRAIKALDMAKESSPGWTIGMMTEKLAPPAPAPGEGTPAAPGTPEAPK